MQIDGRDLDIHNVMKQLKDLFSSQYGNRVDIEILLRSEADARQVSSFAAMSGCSSEIDKKENYYIIHLTGNICCS